MEKIEIIGELKKRVFEKIDKRESIPESINNIIGKIFDNVLELYEENHCDVSSIKQYIDGTMGEVKVQIDNIGIERKNNQFEEFQHIMNRMQRQAEEKEERNEQRDIQEISEVNFRDERNASRIMEIVVDALKDIKNRQNNILESRGYSYDRIEQIDNIVRRYISSIEMRQEENIKYSFDEDRNEIISQILQEYEQYLQYEKSEQEKNKEIWKNQKAEFRNELDAGISLEEQNLYAKEKRRRKKIVK